MQSSGNLFRQGFLSNRSRKLVFSCFFNSVTFLLNMFRLSSLVRSLGFSLFSFIFIFSCFASPSQAAGTKEARGAIEAIKILLLDNNAAAPCTPSFEVIENTSESKQTTSEDVADLQWEIKNTSACDAEDYRLDFHFVDSSGSAADYSDEGYSLFSIKAGESEVVQANIKNIPKKKGKYKVKFNISNNKGKVLPISSGGLQFEGEFEVDDDGGTPDNFMSISAIQLDVLKIEACTDEGGCTVASGPVQLDLLELADGKVNFANQVLLPDNTKELRLVLGENNTITAEGISSALTVPSGSTSGLKLKGQQVFSEKGGFLIGITLDFDLEKDLVVQEEKSNSNGKGKGKKASSDDAVVYSFKLKPVIKVETAQVEALPENMTAVVALPGEDVTLTLGDDFSLQIPAGAVSEATIITAKEIKYFVEVMDESTEKIIRKPGLASTYKLNPEGIQFVKPVRIAIPYNKDGLPPNRSENDLTILHDGISITSQIETGSHLAKGWIEHFSIVTVSYAGCKEGVCKEEIIEDGIRYRSYEFPEPFYAWDAYIPNTKVVLIDRKKLGTKYKLEVLAKDTGDGRFATQTVEQLAKANEAIVAINGNDFLGPKLDYRKESLGSYPNYTTMMDSNTKQDRDGNEVIISFGGTGENLSIPIKRIPKWEMIARFTDQKRGELPLEYSDCSYIYTKITNGDYLNVNKSTYVDDIRSCYRGKNWINNKCEKILDDQIDNSDYLDIDISLTNHELFIKDFMNCVSIDWATNFSSEYDIGRFFADKDKIFSFQEENILSEAIGTHATVLELNQGASESTCKYEGRELFEKVSAIGYSDKYVIFVASKLDSSENNNYILNYDDLCEIFRALGEEKSQAVLLDSGCSSQLVVQNELTNGHCLYDKKPDSQIPYKAPGPRHVVNAIGLVPIDQEEPNTPSDNPITIEENQASCVGPAEYWNNQAFGHDNASRWTWNNDAERGVDNYCTYQFSGFNSGKWEVEAYIPPSHATTRKACYELGDGDSTYGAEIDQYGEEGWVTLGVYEIKRGSLDVTLTDMTDEPYKSHSVGFDAIRLTPAPDQPLQGPEKTCVPRLSSGGNSDVSVFPSEAMLGKSKVFTVTGQNLPSILAFSLDGCDNILALGGTPAVATAAVASMDFAAMAVADADLDGTATSLQFSCTPNSVGLKTGSVDYDNNSYSFTVNVSEAALSCPLGNGYYCGKSSLSQNPNYLYYCQNGIYEEREQCFNGCETMPVGEDDKCSSGTPPQTSGYFIFPFAERESLWQICQGYNTPTISHTSKLIHSFDIAYGSGNLGSTGCWGNIGGSEDKTVIAPAAGTILWNGASDTDITCFQLENSVPNGHGDQIASVKLGHMKSNSARAGAGQYRAQGESIGKLCGPTGCPSAGGYAHTHIGVYTTSDCTGVTVPFGTVFGSGYDFSSDGSLHQWHGTEIPPYGPSPDLPVVNSVSPTNVTLNELTTFTVTGSNLPSALAFFIEECEDLTPLGGSSTSMQFSCTPSWTIGVKNGVVKDETGGNTLYEFTVDVSDDVPEESFTCTSGSQVQNWKNRDWQRCDDGNTYLWQEAKDYCDNLVLGGYSDWRLPTKDELKSLVVCTNGTPTPLADSPDEPYGCGNNNGGNDGSYDVPTIDPSFECQPEFYWSSTPKEVTDTSPLASKELAWGVYFYYGYAAGKNPNTVHAYVRCVR
ncbi:hypothetical protein H206_02231 [Candidatus Electrothrix aarhusensis]|uniref:Uncharacterized protein n=1 Tax=Candidatus Electrothrix aarhusensis TaxID=1859131 RepID=A0A3S3QGY6_9BACT|nr:hypothetical protein H206_02231 [Candidatus Electrothrix aarhusensis]